jgi:hypothetical protein
MTLFAIPFLLFLSPQTNTVERLAWLQGCWTLSSPQRTVEEQWMAPLGNNMVGMSRTVRGGVLVEYELMVIRPQGAGFAYEAHPSGQPSDVFLSIEVTDSSVVFENPKHDFPQIIRYRKTDAQTLIASVEGSERGESRKIDFPYKRSSCAGK